MTLRDRSKFEFATSPSLPPQQRNKGTGYVAFRPAENRTAARKRKGATVRIAKYKP